MTGVGVGEEVARRERLRAGTWPFQLVAALLTSLLLTGAAAAAVVGAQLDVTRRSSLDRFFPRGEARPDIVVVEIDQPAVQQLGWPWPRGLHATLVERLSAARVVAYDVVFDTPAADDARLAAALRDAGNVVLASSGALVEQPDRDVRRLGEPRSEPIELLARAAVGVGLAGVLEETDGVARSVPAVVEVPREEDGGVGAFRAGLAVALLGPLLGVDPDAPTLRPGSVRYGDLEVEASADDDRFFDLNWSADLRWGSPARPHLSALDVLAPGFDPAQLRGAIVLVGATDPLLKDFFRTPVAPGGGGEPGVYVQAQAVNSILTGSYRAPIDDRLALLTVALLSFLVTLVSLRVAIWWIPVVVLGALAANHAWAGWRFGAGSAVDLVYPSLAIGLAGIVTLLLRYVTEFRERRRVAALFGQYVPPPVAEQLIASGRVEAATQGERLDVTVFFCDLRGFTRTAADLEPQQVRTLLNGFYEHVTSLVLAHRGTVMQYVGDEVFAVFGAPITSDDHAQRALDCAVAVRDSVAELSDRLSAGGLPPVAFGIGLNSGPVVAAHVGTFHKQYAVIGDTVNVGSRFCALAQAHQIALPGEVRTRLEREPPLLPVGPVQMKGVARPLEVFKVGRTSEDTPLEGFAANLTPGEQRPKAVELDPDG